MIMMYKNRHTSEFSNPDNITHHTFIWKIILKQQKGRWKERIDKGDKEEIDKKRKEISTKLTKSRDDEFRGKTTNQVRYDTTGRLPATMRSSWCTAQYSEYIVCITNLCTNYTLYIYIWHTSDSDVSVCHTCEMFHSVPRNSTGCYQHPRVRPIIYIFIYIYYIYNLS